MWAEADACAEYFVKFSYTLEKMFEINVSLKIYFEKKNIDKLLGIQLCYC